MARYHKRAIRTATKRLLAEMRLERASEMQDLGGDNAQGDMDSEMQDLGDDDAQGEMDIDMD
jgi:hypothetical protein